MKARCRRFPTRILGTPGACCRARGRGEGYRRALGVGAVRVRACAAAPASSWPPGTSACVLAGVEEFADVTSEAGTLPRALPSVTGVLRGEDTGHRAERGLTSEAATETVYRPWVTGSPRSGKEREGPPRSFRGSVARDAGVLGPGLPQLRERDSVLSHPVCGDLLWQLLQADTLHVGPATPCPQWQLGRARGSWAAAGHCPSPARPRAGPDSWAGRFSD